MITVSFGSGNNVERTVGEYPTVNHILQSRILQSVLGFSADGVSAMVNDLAVPNGAELRDGDRISLITKANSKAV